MAKLILASNSPRRKQLLEEAGFHFEILKLDLEEDYPENLETLQVATYLAHQKNIQYRSQLADEIILTADTIVLVDDQVIGKPKNQKEAFDILSNLSGKIHQVITGVCISSPDQVHTFADITDVEFETLSEQEINYYIENYHPFDKAGSYGIQDWIGLTKIRGIKGSYFNVMGLPINKVYEVLSQNFQISPFHH